MTDTEPLTPYVQLRCDNVLLRERLQRTNAILAGFLVCLKLSDDTLNGLVQDNRELIKRLKEEEKRLMEV